MEPKRNAPKLVAIICVVALLVAIYCSCFAETAGSVPLIHYPYSDTLTALPEPSTEPDTPPVPQSSSTVSDNTVNTVDLLTVALHTEEPSIESQLAGAHGWDDEEVMNYFESVEPSLEYACPYDIHKCVYSMQFNRHELTVTWDIYLFSFDGIIGTWIVNDIGNSISFYGSAFAYGIDNYNIHFGEYYHLSDGSSAILKNSCVYPENIPDPNSFMIVPYREEIAKIS